MITNTYELNNSFKDSNVATKIKEGSPVVEVFSAMVQGKDLSKFNKGVADRAVTYIKELGARAENGDAQAVVELNTLRRFTISAPIMEQIKLLSIFGSYQQLNFDDTVQREVVQFGGERSRAQASGGDVLMTTTPNVERYTVPSYTVSGGYAIDYRRIQNGDMQKENEGLNQVKTDIINRALLSVIQRVYDALKDAKGVNYMFEGNSLTKAGVDAVINKVRPWGKVSVIGEYALLSQFAGWAGYVGTINSNTITGISEAAMNELAAQGIIHNYNGVTLVEIPNPYDVYAPLVTATDGTVNFQKMLPPGLAFVVPAGVTSPIGIWTRGGLTSLTGNNIKTGLVETRFDLEIACDVAKGHEHKVGTIYDASLGGLDVTI